MMGAFNFPAGIAPDDPERLQRALTYFSFITYVRNKTGDSVLWSCVDIAR